MADGAKTSNIVGWVVGLVVLSVTIYIASRAWKAGQVGKQIV